MTSHPKVVFVSSRFPIPLFGGFETKNYYLIKELSKHYEVSAHFIQRTHPSKSDIQFLEQHCKIQMHVPHLKDIVRKMAINMLTGAPLQNALYFSPSAFEAIRKDLALADAAVCSVIRTCDYIEDFEGPKLFDLADSLGQLYMHNLLISKGWRYLAYRIEASRLLRKERQLVENSDGVLFFNKKEAEKYRGTRNVHVVPHGVSEGIFNSFEIESRYADGLSFIGKLDVAHNIDMVLWFSSQILPHLPTNVKLYLIGSKPSPILITLAKKNPRVIILGFMENPYTVLRSSIASICPLQTGGGIQNKILESLACGAITIANSKAIAPFDQINDSGILICDTPADWVRTIKELIDTPLQHYFRRNQGRVYAQSRFSWNAYGEAVRLVLQNAIDFRN